MIRPEFEEFMQYYVIETYGAKSSWDIKLTHKQKVTGKTYNILKYTMFISKDGIDTHKSVELEGHRKNSWSHKKYAIFVTSLKPIENE